MLSNESAIQRSYWWISRGWNLKDEKCPSFYLKHTGENNKKEEEGDNDDLYEQNNILEQCINN